MSKSSEEKTVGCCGNHGGKACDRKPGVTSLVGGGRRKRKWKVPGDHTVGVSVGENKSLKPCRDEQGQERGQVKWSKPCGQSSVEFKPEWQKGL
jgi:hypothetical protein